MGLSLPGPSLGHISLHCHTHTKELEKGLPAGGGRAPGWVKPCVLGAEGMLGICVLYSWEGVLPKAQDRFSKHL